MNTVGEAPDKAPFPCQEMVLYPQASFQYFVSLLLPIHCEDTRRVSYRADEGQRAVKLFHAFFTPSKRHF